MSDDGFDDAFDDLLGSMVEDALPGSESDDSVGGGPAADGQDPPPAVGQGDPGPVDDHDAAAEAAAVDEDDVQVHRDAVTLERDREQGTRVLCTEPECDDWLFVSLLVVPDLERFPLPDDFHRPASEPVDLSRVLEQTAVEVKALVTPTMSDVQLEELRQIELSREKGPRAVVMKAVRGEQEKRGSGFVEWVESHQKSPLRSRIVGMGWQLACTEPHSVSAVTDADEVLLIEQFWSLVGQRVLYTPQAGSVLDVIRVRSLWHDVEARSDARPLRQWYQWPQGEALQLDELAAAINLAGVDETTDLRVFDLYRKAARQPLASEELEKVALNRVIRDRWICLAFRTVG